MASWATTKRKVKMDLMVDCERVMVVEFVLVNKRAVDATWLGDWRDQ